MTVSIKKTNKKGTGKLKEEEIVNKDNVSQVVNVIVGEEKKKQKRRRARRKVKKAKALSTLADILNFQRIQNGFTSNPNAGASGLNAGDVLNIINSKTPKSYTTGMLDGKPIKIEVGMTGKDLEKKILDAYADKDGDNRISNEEAKELKDYAQNLEKAYQDLSFSAETPFKTPQKAVVQDKLKSNLLNWITTKNGKPLRDLYKKINGSVPPRILDITMRGRLIKWLEADDESRMTLEEVYLYEVGDSTFDDSQTGGGLPPPPPPLSPVEEPDLLGETSGGGI